MSKRNVLILSAGRRVELVQAYQQALVQHFNNAQVYTTDLKPELSAACQISDVAFKAPRVTAPEYIDYLLNLCIENEIGLVVPTIDTELYILAVQRERFSAEGIHLIISSTDLISAC